MSAKNKFNAATLCIALALLSLFGLLIDQVWKKVHVVSEGQFNEFKVCKKIERGHGIIRISKSSAELSAIAAWTKNASRHGVEYSFWNNSEEKKLKCGRYPGSIASACFATARPCRNLYSKYEEQFKKAVN